MSGRPTALASACDCLEPTARERLRVAAAHSAAAERRVCAAIDGRERSLGEGAGVQLLLPSSAALFAPDGAVGLEFDDSQGTCVVLAVSLKGAYAGFGGSSPRHADLQPCSPPHPVACDPTYRTVLSSDGRAHPSNTCPTGHASPSLSATRCSHSMAALSARAPTSRRLSRMRTTEAPSPSASCNLLSTRRCVQRCSARRSRLPHGSMSTHRLPPPPPSQQQRRPPLPPAPPQLRPRARRAARAGRVACVCWW